MDILIRPETEKDWFQTEYITKKAFWNLHCPGCDEHYLVHLLRSDPAYLPDISRVAEYDGKVIATIMYSKARVIGANRVETPAITFGPLCVDPEFQQKGVGGTLLKETLQLARVTGFTAVIIYGEPEYYPKFGFTTCDHFGITTADGKNFPAFMGFELVPNSLSGISGKFYEAEVFTNLKPEDVEEYDKQFPFIPKLNLPGQWV